MTDTEKSARHNLIIQIIPGHDRGGTIRDGTEALKKKLNRIKKEDCEVITLKYSEKDPLKVEGNDADARKRISNLDANSRLYIRGHGDWKAQAIGHADVVMLVDFLSESGLKDVDLVSICSCCIGREQDTEGTEFPIQQPNVLGSSYARSLHLQLQQKLNIKCDLYARTENVVISPYLGRGVVDDTYGQKSTRVHGSPDNDKSFKHKQPDSKLQWSWVGDEQRRTFVND